MRTILLFEEEGLVFILRTILDIEGGSDFLGTKSDYTVALLFFSKI